jgi:hypothetical protein
LQTDSTGSGDLGAISIDAFNSIAERKEAGILVKLISLPLVRSICERPGKRSVNSTYGRSP